MTEFIPLLASERDGTSQAQRLLAALRADYVAIDEHSLKDHLMLADAFAKELKYFDFNNVEDGDWQGLLNPNGLEGKNFTDWLQQIEDFIEQPQNDAAAEQYYNLHRPHFVLYLTFLQLLLKTHQQLNQLTGRHLDFYYRQVLNFNKKPAQPDRVNVLIEPSSRISSTLLPAGTLLAAGKDSAGKELVYRSDSDLVVNHIRIARLSSVYVNKQIIGIREAREQYSGTKNDAVMEMLKIALGDPMPGDALPPYPPSNTKVDFALLTQLQTLANFVGTGLFMDITELRSLMQLKYNRGAAADGDWQTINDILAQAAKKRAGSGFKLAISSPRDFDSNLKAALGVSTLDNYFDTLPLVDNITDLYQQRTRQDVKDFIVQKIYLEVETFNQMMRIKVRIDNEWEEINTLLERAGQKKSANYRMVPTEPPDFDKNFASALGTPAYPKVTGIAKINDLDSFYNALLGIEAYFFMALENFVLLMDAATDVNASAPAWVEVYDQLALAHRKKVYAAHKAQLNSLRLGQITPDAQKLAVEAMMQLALGVPATDNSDLPNRIKELLPAGTDLTLLEQAADGVALTENDWDSVCSTLELAWRNRVQTPVAQKTNWLSLSAYNDTLTAKVPGNSDASRWYTFGQRQARIFNEQGQPPETTLGWAVSSPVLCLVQGQRTVTLTLVFNAAQFNAEKITALLANSQPFRIELSTEKGWLNASNVAVKIADYPNNASSIKLKSLSWTISFDESAAAIGTLPDAENSVKASWPVLRLMLQPHWDDVGKNYVSDYPLFQCLLLVKVLLDVQVKGLTDLQLQSDDNSLPSGKPFEPFGNSPTIGSRLYFGHSELTLKKLKKLDINLQWMGVPNANLGDYYKNYTAAIKDNSVFKSKIILVDQRLELLLDGGSGLFNSKDANTAIALTVADIPAQIEKNRSGYHYERQITVDNDKDVTAWQRYWLMELSDYDFQHSAYAGVAAAKSIEMAAAIVNANANKTTITADSYKVNPPYTPKLKSLSINYSASVELDPAELQSGSADQIYHLHPFGYAPMQIDPQSGGYSFLPEYDNEGELYLGLNNVDAPQMLSILLQMADGTANPDLESATVQWSVLSGNQWLDLDKGQLQSDATHGFVQSGIIKFQLDQVAASTLLPSELYWLRATIAERCDSVCDTIGIDTQAVTATFVDQGNAKDHLNQPLPAGSIENLVEPIATIAVVRQPFTSFAAKPEEQDSRFNIRVSERLRHKQRAVTLWDYERLVLEQFPEIYKVKCIPAGLQDSLGQVTVVVIPDVRNRLPFNPFEPKAQAGVLDDIETFLSAQAPLGVSVNVKNACFLPVKLRFAVRFQPGCDSNFYKQQLNEDVNHFLSPWAYEQGKDVVIGGKIYANAIIDFIERCEYVDYVAYFKLFLGDESGNSFQLIAKPPLSDSNEGYAVSATRPDAVLVAARNHDIDLITDVNFGEQIFNGINYMKLELDFIVG
ncbi:MAG: baseplate J/gp47 family protein [Methylobacter sp.]